MLGQAGSIALLLAACWSCAAQSAPKSRVPVVAVSAVPKTATPPAEPDCQRNEKRANDLANEGDQRVKIDVQGAISKYTAALQINPTDHRILWKLAWAYEKTENWQQMVATLERASELAPHHAEYWHKLGYAWVMMGEAGDPGAFESAKEPLEKCIERDPNVARCHHLLGEACQWTDDEPRALLEYSAAIVRDPKVGSFYPPLADLYLALGFTQHAETVLKEGARLVQPNVQNLPHLYAMHILLGSIATLRGDQAAKLRALEEASKYAGEDHPEFAYILGSEYAVMNPPQKERALRLLNQFAKRVCRGSAAMKYKEQCEQASALMQRLGY